MVHGECFAFAFSWMNGQRIAQAYAEAKPSEGG
jgi:hypothetical protein